MIKKQGILLVSHGSRSPRPAAEKAALADRLRVLYPHVMVSTAFLELAEPSITQVLLQMEEERIQELLVLPLMLFPAMHVSEDIPEILRNYTLSGSSMKIHYGSETGASNRIIEAAAQAVRQSGGDKAEGLILLVKGSSNPAVAERGQEVLSGLLERLEIPAGSLCFTGEKKPGLEEALNEMADQGITRLAVSPFFLFSGRLLDRAEKTVADFIATQPGVKVTTAPILYDQPGVLAALADQISF
ncbi:sirohydrochlorin chelatase [Emcibacter sp.]|uniref:sirohydrochlorin chelatase n=1 Tax=Emcibacter sp. TaxID=1979954 RepID=UPI003A90A3C8